MATTEKTSPVSFTVLDADFEITAEKPTISHHVATLNSRGIKVTSGQVIEASCNVDPHDMKIGDPVYVPAPDGGQHTVKGGESLGVIAKKYGVSLARIKEVNPEIKDYNLIYPGQKINLPTAELVCGTTDPLVADASALFDEDFDRADIKTRPDYTFTLQTSPYETSAVADANYSYDPGFGYSNTSVLYDSLFPLLGGSGVARGGVSTDFSALGNNTVAEATVASQEKPLRRIIIPEVVYITVYGINEDLPAELRDRADKILIVTGSYLKGEEPNHEIKDLMEEHTSVYLEFQRDYPNSEYVSALQYSSARLNLYAAREASSYRDRDGFFELGGNRVSTALHHVADGTTDPDKIARRKDKTLALAAELSLAEADKLEGMDVVRGLRKFMPTPFVNKVMRARSDLIFGMLFTNEAELWYEVAKTCKAGEAINDGRNPPKPLTVDNWRFLYHAFDQGLSGSQREEAMAYAKTQIDILSDSLFDEVPNDSPKTYVSASL